MPATNSDQASITVLQDGVKSFASAMWTPQHYEILIDGQKTGELTGYTNRMTCPVPAGPHSVQVRAYARNSVSPTRVYGCSQTIAATVLPGEDRLFRCGVVTGPPIRKPAVLTAAIVTLLLFLGLGPIGDLPLRVRYAGAMAMALATMAFSWIGYSTAPGANIYLRDH